MMIFARYPALVGTLLLLLISTTEGFSSERSPLSLSRPTTTTNKPTKRLPLALEQASVLVPAEEPARGVLRRIQKAVLRPRGGGTTSADSDVQNKGDSFLKRHPFSSAVAITTVNAILADLLTQLVFEGTTNPWNPKRTLVFGAFGFLYQGMVQYAIVNLVWEKVFPGTSKRAVVSKICAMNLFSDPLFFMPTFYIFQEAMTTGTVGWATVKAALLAYKGNCFMDWRNSWMVWFPGHAVTYGVMPTHKRIPWMAFLSFFYMCVLSITRGGV
ncbi:Mpv17 / PMP22 family [Seminavis robusta]|uniref:Mpv17 / PMP22 family n=1 Tax=Seminavis robusta TaxID=568900 RepID=A0A9N8ELX2_9STRA|nr:Mpv17 / PMP22 family [Seminavis robusta]|eukprot:Sro1427_g271790.1 Mpv17 / PMP22 family (271) ;mRNA; r:8954-9766